MKKVTGLVLFALMMVLATGAIDSSVQLVILGNVTSYTAISMPEPESFWIMDAEGRIIPSKKIGDPIVVANWRSWKIKLESLYRSDERTGRLKLDGAETYIPYSFALKDGDTILATSFGVPGPSMARTTSQGKTLSLYFYFTDDGTRWPAGTYRDTLVFSLIAD
ncbi:MAG TPA: hypothetical protein VIO60_02550 [Rectinemataceae bacterium]